MTNLKTLNDLKSFYKGDIEREDFVGIALQSRTKEASKKGYVCRVDVNPEFIHIKSLRQEVIKWIKELLNGTNIFWKETHPFYIFRHDVYPIADFLKNRFNITEEDLK